MIFITTVHIQTQANTNTGGLCCSGTNSLLISWLLTSILRHEERDPILTMLTPSPRAAHLVVFKISFGRDPKNLNHRRNCRELNSQLNGRNSTICLHGPISTPNWLFSKSSNFRTISSGHDVIHTPALFSVWGILWQWWWSYPLRAGVKLYSMTMHLNS